MTPLFAVALLAAAPQAQNFAPVELDRVVSTVHTTRIWKSDVRQARMLKLCPSAESDDAILVDLQNRLMLAEVSRAQPPEPTPEELNTRRREWQTTLGGGGDLDALMARAGMTSRDLQAWHRDDLRIRKYLDLRFGSLPAPQRSARTVEWISDLRQRAGLR
jgi:hypothetical protein